MSDEPLLTRWTFEDFKFFYDVKFGRKSLVDREEKQTDSGLTYGGNYANGSAAANGSAKVPSDTAIYEQFDRQDRKFEPRPGVISDKVHETP